MTDRALLRSAIIPKDEQPLRVDNHGAESTELLEEDLEASLSCSKIDMHFASTSPLETGK